MSTYGSSGGTVYPGETYSGSGDGGYMSDPDEAITLRKHFDQLASARKIYEKTMDDVTEYLDPSLGAFIYKQQKYDPQRKSYRRLESTPINAARQLVARVNAEMTGNSTRWFDFRDKDPIVDAKDEVRRCLQALSDRAYNILNSGVFRTAHIETLLNWCIYGTGGIECWKDSDDNTLQFKAIPWRELYLQENKNNQIDIVYRKFTMQYNQACEFFGAEAISESIHERGREDPFFEIEVIHCVEPNVDYDSTKKKNTKFKYLSRFLIMETNEIVRRGFFKAHPYKVARFWKRPGEVYGGSPAIDCLPDIRLLNLMQEAALRILQRKSEPPLAVAHDAAVLPLRLTPNGINFVEFVNGKPQIAELLENRDNDEVILQAMEQKRQVIRSAFFVDPLLNKDKSIRTAAEVNKRSDEELIGITPFLARLEIEYLVPILEFVLEWVLENNKDIDIPPALHNRIVDIDFSAPLAQTQRGQELQNMVQMLQMVQNLAQVDPTVTQHIDMNAVFAELADLLSVPMKIVKPAKVVAAAQAAAAKQQQQQQQAQNLNAGVQTATGALSNMAKAGLVGRQDVGLPALNPNEGNGPNGQ